MTARVFRLLGAVLVWAVVLVTCGVLVLVCLLPLLLIGVGRGVVGVVGLLSRRGDVAAVPDDLDDVLRARIDGDGEAYAADMLGCGCPRIAWPVAGCRGCDWVTCLAHAGAPHLCERTPLYDWSSDLDWPLVGQLKPGHLDDSAAVPNDLLAEIYQYLEQR